MAWAGMITHLRCWRLTACRTREPGVAPLIFEVVLDTETGKVALDDAIVGWQYAGSSGDSISLAFSQRVPPS